MPVSNLQEKPHLNRLYDWTVKWAYHPYALWVVNIVSFAESSFFPLPPDLMIIPMVLSARERAWWLATTCTLSSVVGGLVGYGIGYWLYSALGQSIINFYHLESSFARLQQQFQEWGFWIIIAKGLTPIPFKLVTIASGATGLDLSKFIAASLISRSFRFFLLSALLWKCGPWIQPYIEKYLSWILGLILLLLVIGYIIIKLFI